jgi:hypothetical protein
MKIGWHRCVVATLALFVSTFIAIPAQAQSSPDLSRHSLVAGLKFDGTTPRVATERNVQQTGTEDQGVGVGVLAGISRTTLHGEGFEDFFDSRTGTMLGAWVGGNMNGRLGFTGEFIYVIRKTDLDFDDDGATDDRLSFPAVEIPAVFHVNFGAENRSKGMFYAIVGPVFTINLKQKVKINNSGESIDISDDFNGADIGILAGAGFEIVRIGVEVRHNWGLRSITDEGDVGNIKTRSWEFLVKFRFN